MLFAKIKNNEVVKFPYGMDDLVLENPSTNFDSRFNLAEWFDQTEAHLLNGFDLVEVVELSIPEIDQETQRIEQSATPSFVNGVWARTLTVVEKTPEEIQANRGNQ